MRSRRRWAITSWPTYACPNAQPGAHRAAAAANCAAGAASQTASAATRVQPYGSTLDGVRTIVRQEGVMALWRGTSASLLMVRVVADVRHNKRLSAAMVASSLNSMQHSVSSGKPDSATSQACRKVTGSPAPAVITTLAILCTENPLCRPQAVPMVGIYFPLYDALTAHLEASSPRVAPYAPLLAGSAARTVAVLCTSPLELIRTRMQANPPTSWAAGAVSSLRTA